MTVLYVISRFITFPGAFIRAFWEQVVCRIHRCVVEDNRYLRRDEQCSHIEHELFEGAGTSFLIGFVPMVLQFITALLVSLSGVLDILYLGSVSTEKLQLFTVETPITCGTMDIICLWLGASLLINCFPSVEDALNMKEKVFSKETGIVLKIILAPFTVIMYIGAFLERYLVTFLTTAALTALALFKL